MQATAPVSSSAVLPFEITLPPKEATSLSSVAMLCSLSISSWTGYRYDKETSEEIADLHAAEKDAGRFNKRLVPRNALKEITQAIGQARRDHEFLTLPWSDGGARLLPGATYMEHTNLMRQRRQEFEAAVARFAGGFENLVRSQSRLGTLLKVEDYPGMIDDAGILRFVHPNELRSRFSFSTKIDPIHDANDFRVAIGDEERERIKRQIAQSVEASIRVGTRDLWQRLYDAVAHMSARMNEYNVAEEGNKPKLYQSMISNIVHIVDILPRLNIAGDSDLNRMAEEVRKALVVDTKDLKKSETVRTGTARAATDIAQRMAAYMGLPIAGPTSSGPV